MAEVYAVIAIDEPLLCKPEMAETLQEGNVVSKPPNWTPKHVEIAAALISLVVTLLSVLLAVVEKGPQLASFFGAVNRALSWQVNVWFAAATEVLPAAAIVCLCWQAQRSAKSQSARIRADIVRLLGATYHFVVAAGAYYVLLVVFGAPDGSRSVGHNVVLEFANLYIGFSAWDLARTLEADSSVRRSPARKYAPLIGLVLLAALFAVVAWGGAAEWFGWSRDTVLLYLTAFGSTSFVAGCGWRLSWAAKRARAPWFGKFALDLYASGLTARVAMVLLSCWSGIAGMSYFSIMAAKWAIWSVVAFAIARMISKPKTCTECGAEREDAMHRIVADGGETATHRLEGTAPRLGETPVLGLPGERFE